MIFACILAVGDSVGIDVNFRVAGFLSLFRPAGIDGVTVIARVVRGLSLGEVGASLISSLGSQTPDAMKSSAACWYS